MILQPGDLVIDTTSEVGRVLSPATLHALGIKGICRYTPPFGGSWKHLAGARERDVIIGAGFGLINNVEVNGSWWMLPSRGTSDGAKARDTAYGLAMPPQRPIVYSVDADTRGANRGIARSYIANADGADDPYATGCYGGSRTLRALTASSFNWLAGAESWSDPADWAAVKAGNQPDGLTVHLWQLPPSEVAARNLEAGPWDWNVVMAPFEVWSADDYATPAPPVTVPPIVVTPPPTPSTAPAALLQGDDMPAKLIRVDQDAAVLAVAGTVASSAVSGSVIADLQGVGVFDTQPVRTVARSSLKALHYVGALPDYSTGDGGLSGRTQASDFATFNGTPQGAA